MDAVSPKSRRPAERMPAFVAPQLATLSSEVPEGDLWGLSIGRANAVREILANAGMPSERFSSVTGKGDTEPLIKDNPYLPYNRRVGIVLKAEAPATPNGLKP